MTQATETDQHDRFEGDRYERLRRAAEVLATGEDIASAEGPYNSEGLRAFASTIHRFDMFTGLTDEDSDFVGMLLLLDFHRGPQHMAWRVGNLLSDIPAVPHEYDDEIGVIATYVEVLGMLLTAFRSPDTQRVLTRLAADAAEAYDAVKAAPGNAGDYLRAARDSIADAIEAGRERR